MGFFYIVGRFGAAAWDYDGLNIQHVEIFGKGYIVEHCVALFKKRNEELLFRRYVADSIHMINSLLYKKLGGSAYKQSYSELTAPQKEQERSGDEIAADIIKRAGLKVKQ